MYEEKSSPDELYKQHIRQRERCLALLQISSEDAARMVREYTASGGGIAVLPAAYAAQSDQYCS
jgi:hypothetical protein